MWNEYFSVPLQAKTYSFHISFLMRVLTMKKKNCHIVRKNVKVVETESQEEVQEVDTPEAR